MYSSIFEQGVLSECGAERLGMPDLAGERVVFATTNGVIATVIFWKGVYLPGILDVGPGGVVPTSQDSQKERASL